MMDDTRPGRWIALLALLAVTVSGCASLGRGLGEAFLKPKEEKDTRQCWVRGRAFEGTESSMARQEQAAAQGTAVSPVLKVLMVHGIGSHQPGYSTSLAESMAREMELDHVKEKFKQFELAHPEYPGQDLGTLRVSLFRNAAATRDMFFYELTWDPIVEAEKRTIDFDNSGDYAFRRTSFNDKLKRFVNDTVPDVLMYDGRFREPIQISVGQSLCWMLSETWDGLPGEGRMYCDPLAPQHLDRIGDDYVFITHSLGSRVTADALQRIAAGVQSNPRLHDRAAALREKRLTVFMMSNQLPLLQLGQALPEVHGQIPAICDPGSGRDDERLFRETRFVAFSDPNDLFSYAIPPRFFDQYVDSRLCPTLTNVILNVVNVTDLMGLGGFANPMAAHLGYSKDERVIALMTRGIGNAEQDPMISERCEWLESIPEGE